MTHLDIMMLCVLFAGILLGIMSIVWCICDWRIARNNVAKLTEKIKKLEGENKRLKADYSKLQARANKYIKKGV